MIRALEQEYGSIIRGALAKARIAKKKKPSGEKLEMPAMTSFPEGMQRLTDKLTESVLVDRELLYDYSAEKILKQENGWTVTTGDRSFDCTMLCLRFQ